MEVSWGFSLRVRLNLRTSSPSLTASCSSGQTEETPTRCSQLTPPGETFSPTIADFKGSICMDMAESINFKMVVAGPVCQFWTKSFLQTKVFLGITSFGRNIICVTNNLYMTFRHITNVVFVCADTPLQCGILTVKNEREPRRNTKQVKLCPGVGF